MCVPAVAAENVDMTVALYGRRLTLAMQRRRQRGPRVAADVIHLRRHDVATIASVRVAGGDKQVVAVRNHHMIATTLHGIVNRCQYTQRIHNHFTALWTLSGTTRVSLY